MAEYTYKDVIIDPEDPRVELWEEYYFGRTPFECLLCARKDKPKKFLKTVFKDTDKPFSYSSEGSDGFSCIIRANKSKKYVPFDLSKSEVRDKLRGKYLIHLDVGDFTPEEKLVVGFSENTVVIGGYDPECFDGHELLKYFTFLDGTPCGELVEVEDASK